MSLPPSRNDLVEAQRLRKADNLSNKLLALASKDLYLSQKRMKRGQEEEKGTGIVCSASIQRRLKSACPLFALRLLCLSPFRYPPFAFCACPLLGSPLLGSPLLGTVAVPF